MNDDLEKDNIKENEEPRLSTLDTSNMEQETLGDNFFKEFDEDDTTGNLEDDLLEELDKISEDSISADVPLDMIKKEDNKKPKKKLTKKQLIIIGIISVVILVIIIVLILYFAMPKNEDSPDVPGKEEEHIVIDNGNYKYEDGYLVFLNENKTEIGKYECQDKSEDKCYVAYLSNSGDVNVTKNVYEDNSEVKFRSTIFHNRYVFITDGDTDTIKLYDILENKEIKTYKEIKYNSSMGTDSVILKDTDDKYGVVKLSSNDVNTLVKFEYDSMDYLDKKDNKLVVSKGNKYYLVDLNGKTLTKTFNNPIYDYSDNYFILKTDKTYTLVDKNNKTIYSDYSYISIVNDNYVALVKDDNVYIKDYENNKYNEIGYSLVNFDYSGTNTYNSEGTLISNNYSYKVSTSGDYLTIFIKDDKDTNEYNLYLKDGEVSKNIPYYSNFDGILYFYSDKEKEDLLGSYICTNKNDLSVSETFNYCQVAVNYIFDDNFKNNGMGLTNKLLPIVNNRYVFISDSSIGLEGDISVYDLVEGKTLATYQKVSIKNNYDNLTFVDDIESIIALNKSNKYGMISIKNKGISKTYDFEYDSMERIGTEILVLKNNKYQILYDNKSTSTELNTKIYDYTDKYFVVKGSNGYDIYMDAGNDTTVQITDTSYKVIKLVGDSCYITIDNDLKVHIYLYDNTLVNTTDIILANDTDYNLYNMVSASKIDNTIIVNTFDNAGNRLNSYTFTITSKTSSTTTTLPSTEVDDNIKESTGEENATTE